MKYFQILIFFFFATLIVSCTTKNDFTPTTTATISKEFKSYAVFDTNSYWVYRNEKNSEIDTVKIASYYTEKRYNNPEGTTPGYYYDSYYYTFTSNRTELINGEVTGGYTGDPEVTMPESYRVYFANGRYFTIFRPRYPFGEIEYLGINEGNYTNVAFHASLSIGSSNYTDVFETTVKDYKNAPDTLYMRYFIAKDFGLVRFTQKSNEVDKDWILIDSQLINVP